MKFLLVDSQFNITSKNMLESESSVVRRFVHSFKNTDLSLGHWVGLDCCLYLCSSHICKDCCLKEFANATNVPDDDDEEDDVDDDDDDDDDECANIIKGNEKALHVWLFCSIRFLFCQQNGIIS